MLRKNLTGILLAGVALGAAYWARDAVFAQAVSGSAGVTAAAEAAVAEKVRPARIWPAPSVSPEPPAPPRTDLLPEERTTINLFREASPSVVYIESAQRRRDVWSRNILKLPQGAGSGFVWDDEGHIVTNYHVIAEATDATVTLTDHTHWDAIAVGVAPDKDLAVLKIDAPKEKLKALRVGTSSNLQVGQNVLAIGNPFGLDQTLTTGIISGLDREIESLTRRPIQGVIQTDAAINPGNSGGPLLDSSGRVIGMNTAIYSTSGSYAGVGFAVPVDEINRIVPELITHGKIIRPVLGIHPADETITRRWGLDGVLVVNIIPGSGAEKAGIRATMQDQQGRILLGDRILAVNGTKVSDADDLYSLLDRQSVGDTVRVTLDRDGKEEIIPIELSAAQ